MITEIAILDVKPGQRDAYEAAFREAIPFLKASPGYLSHELIHCMESPDRYLLIVRWETLEAHTVGFRGSPAFQEWKRLTHPFYEPYPPRVEHYETVVIS